MKKTFILLMFIATSVFSYSQKIVEDKVDEFTKNKIIRTDWEKISATSKLYMNARISKINDSTYLDIKIVTNSVTSISPKNDISFMFNDGLIININSTKYQLSNYGDGAVGLVGSNALGISIHCLLTDNDIEKFKTDLVTKIRINKSEGYSEEEIKEKNAEKFRKQFLLIYK